MDKWDQSVSFMGDPGREERKLGGGAGGVAYAGMAIAEAAACTYDGLEAEHGELHAAVSGEVDGAVLLLLRGRCAGAIEQGFAYSGSREFHAGEDSGYLGAIRGYLRLTSFFVLNSRILLAEESSSRDIRVCAQWI